LSDIRHQARHTFVLSIIRYGDESVEHIFTRPYLQRL